MSGVTLTAGEMAALTCHECGGAILGCSCSADGKRYHAAFDLWIGTGGDRGDAMSAFSPIAPPPYAVEPQCHVEPVAEPTYEQRREEIARRRNPGPRRIRWSVLNNPQRWTVGGEAVYATQDEDGFWSFTSWGQPDTSGIQRAAENLNRHEHRLGAARYQP